MKVLILLLGTINSWMKLSQNRIGLAQQIVNQYLFVSSYLC